MDARDNRGLVRPTHLAVEVDDRTPRQRRDCDLPGLEDGLRDPQSVDPQQPEYAQNANRSIKPEILVAVGICTHLGCSPSFVPEALPQPYDAQWKGGFFCPCHGSKFDLAGRVYKGVPAPTNLRVPPYRFVRDDLILIGQDTGAA